jgi:hypothetical protein
VGSAAKCEIIGIRKRGEANAKVILVGAAKRVIARKTGEIDVLCGRQRLVREIERNFEGPHIVQDHDIANTIFWIQSSSGIGYDDGLDS